MFFGKFSQKVKHFVFSIVIYSRGVNLYQPERKGGDCFEKKVIIVSHWCNDALYDDICINSYVFSGTILFILGFYDIIKI